MSQANNHDQTQIQDWVFCSCSCHWHLHVKDGEVWASGCCTLGKLWCCHCSDKAVNEPAHPWDTPVNSHVPAVLLPALHWYLFVEIITHQIVTAFSACYSTQMKIPNSPDDSYKVIWYYFSKSAFLGVKLPIRKKLQAWWDRKPPFPSMLQGIHRRGSHLLSPIISKSMDTNFHEYVVLHICQANNGHWAKVYATFRRQYFNSPGCHLYGGIFAAHLNTMLIFCQSSNFSVMWCMVGQVDP